MLMILLAHVIQIMDPPDNYAAQFLLNFDVFPAIAQFLR